MVRTISPRPVGTSMKKLNIVFILQKDVCWNRNMLITSPLHKWVKKNIPANKYCENCKQEKKLDLANIAPRPNKTTYTKDPTNWRWLCRSCHMKEDKRLVGIKNGHWKGDKVGRHALYKWVRKYKPISSTCAYCNTEKGIMELFNLSGEFKRDINDFIFLCRSCHMKRGRRSRRI